MLWIFKTLGERILRCFRFFFFNFSHHSQSPFSVTLFYFYFSLFLSRQSFCICRSFFLVFFLFLTCSFTSDISFFLSFLAFSVVFFSMIQRSSRSSNPDPRRKDAFFACVLYAHFTKKADTRRAQRRRRERRFREIVAIVLVSATSILRRGANGCYRENAGVEIYRIYPRDRAQ